MTTPSTPTDQVMSALAAEGFDPDDIIAAIGSLIDTGLTLNRPVENYIFTADEIDTLRAQLATGVTA